MRFFLAAAFAASMWGTATAEVFTKWDRVVLGELPRSLYSAENAVSFSGLIGVKADYGIGPAAIYDVTAGDYVWAGGFTESVDNLGFGRRRLSNGEQFVFFTADSLYVVPPDFGAVRIDFEKPFAPRAINDAGTIASTQPGGFVHLWPQATLLNVSGTNEQPTSGNPLHTGVSVAGLTNSGILAGSVSSTLYRWSEAAGLDVLDVETVETDFELTNHSLGARAVTESGLVYGVTHLGLRFTWDGQSIATWEGLNERTNEHGATIVNGTPIGSVLATPYDPPVFIGDEGENAPGIFPGQTYRPARGYPALLDWQLLTMESEGFFGAARYYLVRYDPVRIPGDYNGNGTVEQADLDQVLLHWGRDQLPASWLHDLPSGPIDQAELDRVLLSWGSGASAMTLAAGTVPEPSALAIILGCLFVSTFLRRTK